MKQYRKSSKIAIALSVIISIIMCMVIMSGFSTVKYSTSARSAIVIERTTGRIFFERNADEKLPIASTTKILTAITVIENTDDLNKEVVVPDEAVGTEGSSIYLKHGEKLRIIDLLYGLMLRSGNDCAVALACVTSGSVSDFAYMMNTVARNASAVNSHFVNPHGLQHEEHYSTARDLAAISAYAMRNDIFRRIVSTERYTDCPYEGEDYNRDMRNKNKILNMLEGGNGIKTGYTKVAGRCLVSSACRDGKEVICVVLSCGPMFEESCDLINNAFEELGVRSND